MTPTILSDNDDNEWGDSDHQTGGVSALPTEILIDVLERASVADVQACLQTSRRLRVAAQTALSPLKRRMDKEGLEYIAHNAQTAATTSTLFTALDDRARNWHDFTSTPRLTIPYSGPRVQFLMGNGFVILCPSIRSTPWILKVIQLPHTQPDLANEHVQETHETSSYTTSLCDFAIDTAQDVVITAEFLWDEDCPANSRMYLRPLSVKSLARHPLMVADGDKLEARILMDRSLSSSRPNLHIAGDYVALYVGPLLIFNWKTGQSFSITQPPEPQSAAHTFITPTAILLLLHVDEESPIFFKLYRLITSQSGPVQSEKWTHCATFQMPLLYQHVNDVHIWASPYADAPAHLVRQHTPRIRSRMKIGSGLVVIRLRGWDNVTHASTANLCVFRKEVFLRDLKSFEVPPPPPRPPTVRPRPVSSGSESSLVEARGINDDAECNPFVIPWHKWGPGQARFITDRRFVTARGVTSSCHGYRLVTMTAGMEHLFGAYSGKISVLDFNPDSVDWAVTTARKQMEEGYVRGKDDILVELDPSDWKFSIKEDEQDDARSSTGGDVKPSKLPARIKRRVVTETSKINARDLFIEEVESTLPFYEIIQGTDSIEVCELRVDQDRLYVARKHGENPGIIVHCF